MRILLLIPCCKTKIKNGKNTEAPSEILKTLMSKSDYNNLIEKRKELLSKCSSIKLSKDFGGSASALFLPAIERYAGYLYKVPKLVDTVKYTLVNNQNCHILIVSALYGLLHPFDDIQDYELLMGKALSTWKTYLPQAIKNYMNNNSIDQVHTFFGESTDYNKSTKDLDSIIQNIVRHIYDDSKGKPKSRTVPQWHGEKLLETLQKINT